MPFIFADDLDEPIVSDGFPSFDGGMVSAPAAKLLQANQYAYGENLTIDTEGRICTRRGCASYFAQFSDQANPAFIWSVTTSNATALLAAVYGASGRRLYSMPNTAAPGIYFSAGNVVHNAWASSFLDLFLDPAHGFAPYTPFVFWKNSPGPLPLVSGTTYYTFPNDADSYGASLTRGGAQVNLTSFMNSGLLATTDGSFPDFSGNIPATALGLDGLYFAQTQIPLTVYNGTDNGFPLLAFLNAPPGGVVTNAPPRMSILCWHQGRLFGAGASGARDTLYSSDIFDVATWRLQTGSLRVGDGNDEIVALSSWIDTAMVVWEKRSIWILDADPTTTPANWGVRNITRRLGLLSPYTVAAVNGDIWGLTTDGLRSIGRLFGTEQTVEIGNPLSQAIRDIIHRMTPGREALAVGQYYKGRYFLSIAIDGSQTNNCLLVWRDIASAWEGIWTNLKIAHMAVDNTQAQPALLLGTVDGQILQWKDNVQDFAATDDTYTDYLPNGAFNATVAVPVVAKLRTRASVMQDFLARKRGWLLDIEFYQSLSQTVEVYAILDGGTPYLVATVDSRSTTGAVSLPTVLPWTLPAAQGLCRRTIKYKPAGRYREVQFELRATDGRYLCVSNMVATAFLETIKVSQ